MKKEKISTYRLLPFLRHEGGRIWYLNGMIILCIIAELWYDSKFDAEVILSRNLHRNLMFLELK